jgi:hypothetical protein
MEPKAARTASSAEVTRDIPSIRRISSVNGKFEQPLIGKMNILMLNFAFPITQPISA